MRRRGSAFGTRPDRSRRSRLLRDDLPGPTVIPRERAERASVGTSPAQFVALGFVGGLAIGVLAWSGALRVSRRELFSASPLRRFAALSYLGGNPSASSARLLRDYVRWETTPALRRRAERILRWVEDRLE